MVNLHLFTGVSQLRLFSSPDRKPADRKTERSQEEKMKNKAEHVNMSRMFTFTYLTPRRQRPKQPVFTAGPGESSSASGEADDPFMSQ